MTIPVSSEVLSDSKRSQSEEKEEEEEEERKTVMRTCECVIN
jgi:ribosomal protein S20